MADAPKPNVNTRMPKGAKRPKTSRACLACRKLKARCEPAAGAKPVLIDDPQSSSTTYTICHRCKTLCIDCLYESPTGQVVKGEDVLPLSASTPSPPAEHNRPPRSNKRSRPQDDPSATSDPFSNDRAVFLSPAISPSPLTRSIYRDIDICSLQSSSPASLERPVLIANAFSRLIGAAPALKHNAQQYLLSLSGAFPQDAASSDSWKQAPADLCLGKVAARLMSGHAPSPPYPQHEVIFLSRLLQPHEHPMRILFQGLYGPFSPFLSIPFEESLNLSTCQSEAQCFLLLTIYLVALPHLEPTMSMSPVRQPLRKAVDVLLRRVMHTPANDHLNIFALHNCASFLLLPGDGMVEAHRPISTPEQEDDGLLEFALDLNPRAAIITALIVAQKLGYASLASQLPTIRQSIEADSPAIGHAADQSRDEYAHAVLCTFTWLTLLQFRASIDVAEERIEWDSLAQFEQNIPRIRIEALTASILPPPSFLSPREQSRCCWMAQRAELYAIARDHRHTKRASASFTKKEAEEQAAAYKKAVDEWRYKFNEQMRSMSTEFRRDPRGLGLHRYYSIFANAEAQSLQVSIGSVYHKEFVSDMRPRLEDPFYQDNIPWKSAPAIMLGHENDRLTKAILINFAFTDAMLKAMGHISSLTPVMPQLYDFVSYEESAGSEIPSLCIVAPPNIQAGLFAVPLLAAADLRLSVIETWGASASYFNHHLLPLLTNCVKSLRACHVNVALPGVLKIPFTTANPIADYLQGPFEILMRKVASAEERLQISHVESILTNAFLLSRKKKEIETIAEELAPDAPEMVQAIADSQKIEDEISASMMGSVHVQAIQEIEEDDAEYAVKVFGSDLRQGDIKAVRRSGSGIGSKAATPDTEACGRGGRQIRVSNEDSKQRTNTLKSVNGQSSPTYRGVHSGTDTTRLSSPTSTTQSLQSLPPGTLANSSIQAVEVPHDLSAQRPNDTFPSAALTNEARSSPSVLHQRPPSAFGPTVGATGPPHTMQSDAFSTASYTDRGAPGAASSRSHVQGQVHDEQHPPPSRTSAYASHSNADGRVSSGGELAAFLPDSHSTQRLGASDQIFAYEAGPDVPPVHAIPSEYDVTYRRPSDVRAGGAAFPAGYSSEAVWPVNASDVAGSEPWPASTHQQQPQYGNADRPDHGFRGHVAHGKFEPFPAEAPTSRQAAMYAGPHELYPAAHQHPSQYAGQHDGQYQMQHPSADHRYLSPQQQQQQQQQMHPGQHGGGTVGMPGHYAPADQSHAGESQPPPSAAWDVWNWTPGQQPQHQQQAQQHHHQQQQQQYPQQHQHYPG